MQFSSTCARCSITVKVWCSSVVPLNKVRDVPSRLVHTARLDGRPCFVPPCGGSPVSWASISLYCTYIYFLHFVLQQTCGVYHVCSRHALFSATLFCSSSPCGQRSPIHCCRHRFLVFFGEKIAAACSMRKCIQTYPRRVRWLGLSAATFEERRRSCST